MSILAAPRGNVITPAEVEAGLSDGSLFDHSAWRLETLDWYTSPATEARLARFLAGSRLRRPNGQAG